LAFQQCSSGAPWFWRESTHVDFDPIDVNLDDDHIGVREPWWKMRIEITRPYASHYCDVFDDSGPATQRDIAVSGGMLKGKSD
jgi:hypothetical protein